ncbi:MAG: phosphate acyltransferase PlsX [Gammaproteobacteria bacterium]|nr:phosphate acyltransferase PlsX [Gammaproteobacteria bacterium]
MSAYYTLALDAMGGDLGPNISLEAALASLERHPRLTLYWVGPQAILVPLMDKVAEKQAPLLQRLHIIDAPHVVEKTDDLMVILRQKQTSSMYMALALVANGKANACVSGGSSAALMALSRHLIKMLPGYERPAFASHIPTRKGICLVLDMGANLSSSAEQLYQFGQLGQALEASLQQNPNITLKLLNIATESGTGQTQVQQADALLESDPKLNYLGYIEPQEVFEGQASVVVCDGYAGNILIKSGEGVSNMLARSFMADLANSDIAPEQIEKVMQAWQFKFDPDRLNGAFLLGLQGLVVKSHSYASATALQYAIEATQDYVEMQVAERLQEEG